MIQSIQNAPLLTTISHNAGKAFELSEDADQSIAIFLPTFVATATNRLWPFVAGCRQRFGQISTDDAPLTRGQPLQSTAWLTMSTSRQASAMRPDALAGDRLHSRNLVLQRFLAQHCRLVGSKSLRPGCPRAFLAFLPVSVVHEYFFPSRGYHQCERQ